MMKKKLNKVSRQNINELQPNIGNEETKESEPNLVLYGELRLPKESESSISESECDQLSRQLSSGFPSFRY